MPKAGTLVDVLLAESNDGHAELTQASLREAGVVNAFHRRRDGVGTLAFVHRKAKREAGTEDLPLLIVLDVDLPGTDGIEVLRSLRADPRTSSMPVVMTTTSRGADEAQRCRRLGCNAYVSKWTVFLGMAGFSRELRRLVEIAWAQARKLPLPDPSPDNSGLAVRPQACHRDAQRAPHR